MGIKRVVARVKHEAAGRREMWALVNKQQQLLLAPDGNFYSGLPTQMSSIFLFPSEDDAERAAKRYLKPKFTAMPVYVDAKGYPWDKAK